MNEENLNEIKQIDWGNLKPSQIVAIDFLIERLQELERELERIKVKYQVTKESHYNCSKSTSELEQQNERYREALEFYANRGHYARRKSFRIGEDDVIFLKDDGVIAREALEEPE